MFQGMKSTALQGSLKGNYTFWQPTLAIWGAKSRMLIKFRSSAILKLGQMDTARWLLAASWMLQHLEPPVERMGGVMVMYSKFSAIFTWMALKYHFRPPPASLALVSNDEAAETDPTSKFSPYVAFQAKFSAKPFIRKQSIIALTIVCKTNNRRQRAVHREVIAFTRYKCSHRRLVSKIQSTNNARLARWAAAKVSVLSPEHWQNRQFNWNPSVPIPSTSSLFANLEECIYRCCIQIWDATKYPLLCL